MEQTLAALVNVEQLIKEGRCSITEIAAAHSAGSSDATHMSKPRR